MKWLFKHTRDISTLLVVLVFCALCIMLLFFDIKPRVKDAFLVMLGFLGKTVSSLFDYWYGSSEEKEEKNTKA